MRPVNCFLVAFATIVLAAACGGGDLATGPSDDASALVPARQGPPAALCPVTEDPGPPRRSRLVPRGLWTGDFDEEGYGVYPIRVKFLGCVRPGRKIADVLYPSFPCSGEWILNRYTASGMEVTEVVDSNICDATNVFALTIDWPHLAIDGDGLSNEGDPLPPGTFTFSLAP